MPPVLRRAVVAALMGVLGVLGAAAVTAPASAHDVLTGSSPAAGSTVTVAPTEVTVSFEEPPLAAGLALSVTAPGGALVTAAPATLRGSDVVAPLRPLTAAGVYTVAYRAVADDGHPVTGTFTFTLADPGASASASGRPSDPVAVTQGPAPEASGSSALPWVVGGGVVLVLVALGVGVGVALRRGAA